MNNKPELNIIDRFDNPDVSMWEVFNAAKERGDAGVMPYNTFANVIYNRTNQTALSLLVVARILGLGDPDFLQEQGITENISASMISNLYNHNIGFRFEESTGKVIAYDTTKYKLTTIKVQK